MWSSHLLIAFQILTSFGIKVSMAETVQVELNRGALRLRQNPQSGSESCGTVPNGTSLNLIRSENGWYQVSTDIPNCPTAWIHSYFTSEYYNGKKSAEFLSRWNPSSTQIEVGEGQLRLRNRPNAGASTCGTIDDGAQVEKLVENNGWFLIKTNNSDCPTAWIHGYYTQGQYQGPQTRSYLNSWRPSEVATDTTAADESTPEYQVHVSTSNYSGDHSIEDVSTDTPASPEIDLIQTVGNGISSEATDRFYANPSKTKSFTINPDETEILRASMNTEISSDDYALASGPAYNATQNEREICTFYVEQNGTRTSEIDRIKTNNCMSLLEKANRGEIPKDALLYTLNFLKLNLGGLKDDSCVSTSSQPQGLPEPLQNSCQFIINDMNQRISGFPNRSPTYFIDLCHGRSGSVNKGLITKSYVNRGTGSSNLNNPNYLDTTGRKTTVIGAFVTGAYSPFTPYRVSQKYRSIGYGRCKAGTPIEECNIPRLALYGVMESNNSSTSRKPMHVSPYNSSNGCPSINQDDRWKMTALYRNGPSLVMNYGPERFHTQSSLTNCNNGNQ